MPTQAADVVYLGALLDVGRTERPYRTTLESEHQPRPNGVSGSGQWRPRDAIEVASVDALADRLRALRLVDRRAARQLER